MRTIFRWLCPAGVATSGELLEGHFFAANRCAHVISPPLAASRPDMMFFAGVAELVDALDLGSSDESCGGSSPSARTKRSRRLTMTIFGSVFAGASRRDGSYHRRRRQPDVVQIDNVRPLGRTKREED